jgi:general secretion pathway protein D
MRDFNRLLAVLLTAALIGPLAPLDARTRKGDKFLLEGRALEQKKEWDAALENYEKALSEDPSDVVYQMAAEKARFQASQMHIDEGFRVREQGKLGDALLEFQKAYQISPGSTVAEQEIARTQGMIQRDRKRVEETGQPSTPEERAMTPVDEVKKQTEDRIRRMKGVPELKPLNPAPIDLKMNNQTVKVLFETVGKQAGINVLWDPDYQNPPNAKPMSVDIQNSTIEEALDYLSVITKSYWKPLSSNAIFVTNDNPNKRRDFAEMVAKTFYLTNVSLAQELQEVMNVVRTISEVTRVVVYNSQNAIIVRGEADQVALAEKLIRDLDKPRGEVVVDIIVIEANSSLSRQITAAIASTGLNVPITFNPRTSIQVKQPGTGTDTGTGTGTDTTSGLAIPLSQVGHLSSADFSVVLPNALLQAVLSDTKSKVLQSPELRALDNTKALLKIGDREPTATGSFQPGIGGVGINPLVNTQFNYLDVGVNVEITPRIHENGDVSMHISLDISTVNGYVDLGGLKQPIIGQRRVEHDIRMHEGEVSLLAGLTKTQEDKSVSGIPGLSSIPLLRRLFTGESTNKVRGDVMIALVPHIVRRPDYTPDNLKGISVGNSTSIKLNYAPREQAAPAPAPVVAAPVVPVPGAPAAVTPPATAPATAAQPGATPPATAPPGAPTATAPPATAPPATAPPATAPPTGTEPPQPSGNVRLRLTPSQVDTSVSNTFTVAVQLEGGTDVASAPMQIQFDPKVLRLVDVSRGDYLSNDGQPPVFTKNIMNDTGTAAIQLNRLPGAPGASGSGTLVTLTFQTVAKGATNVTIPNLTVRNSQGQVLATATPRLIVNVR